MAELMKREVLMYTLEVQIDQPVLEIWLALLVPSMTVK